MICEIGYGSLNRYYVLGFFFFYMASNSHFIAEFGLIEPAAVIDQDWVGWTAGLGCGVNEQLDEFSSTSDDE